MVFENPEIENSAEEENFPSPEHIQESAADIFEEEKRKLEGKMKQHNKAAYLAAFLAIVAGVASFENAHPGTEGMLRQGIEYFGASPEWTAVLNIWVVGYDFSQVRALKDKIKKLKKPKQKTSYASGSE